MLQALTEGPTGAHPGTMRSVCALTHTHLRGLRHTPSCVCVSAYCVLGLAAQAPLPSAQEACAPNKGPCPREEGPQRSGPCTPALTQTHPALCVGAGGAGQPLTLVS